METTRHPIRTFFRGLAWFLLLPLIALLILAGVAYSTIGDYQAEHENRIYTGISIWDIDVSGMTREEALAHLQAVIPVINERVITLRDGVTGQQWTYTSSELGVSYDFDAVIEQAYQIGRNGTTEDQLREQFDTWYQGRTFMPQMVVDEAYADEVIREIANAIENPAIDSTLNVNGDDVSYTAATSGLTMDKEDARVKLLAPLAGMTSAEINLLVTEVAPRVTNLGNSAESIQRIIGAPLTLYLEQPYDGADLKSVVISTQQLSEWLVVNTQGDPSVIVDEVALRNWVTDLAPTLERQPRRARFYFDDYTQQLVLIEPHQSGRELDIDTTVANILAAVESPNRSIPIAVREIAPLVHSEATAEELGIVQLVSEATTYFYGSPPNRMHNIARGATEFYGIVIAPGEEFSFNNYLGEISEENGYLPGLIISGGRTIAGVGGGICQVSTTLYQAAFWAGLGIQDRQEHGYRVHYYEDGFGPDGRPNVGMDATIFTPLVDFNFINDTEHHLLVENYYHEGDQSLTFKFYSTDIGRTVVRNINIFNETDPKADVWEYDPELDEGEIEQVDWAIGGADVTVERIVYNFAGEVRHHNYYTSHYEAWQNVYKYGPNTDLTFLNTPDPTEPPPADDESP